MQEVTSRVVVVNISQFSMEKFKLQQDMIKLTKQDGHMQVKCPTCNMWLETEVCQTSNGHKFHKNCLKMSSAGGRCPLCEEDKILTKDDCFKQQEAYSDGAAMKDLGDAKVKCHNCGFVGPYRELKMRHAEQGCKYVGCTCAIS